MFSASCITNKLLYTLEHRRRAEFCQHVSYCCWIFPGSTDSQRDFESHPNKFFGADERDLISSFNFFLPCPLLLVSDFPLTIRPCLSVCPLDSGKKQQLCALEQGDGC